jgi:hypothetical protein
MLRRRPSRRRSSPSPAERRRERKRLQQARWRERDRKGIKIARVPVDAVILNWLEQQYPGKCDVEDLDDVGRLIGAVLRASARE